MPANGDNRLIHALLLSSIRVSFFKMPAIITPATRSVMTSAMGAEYRGPITPGSTRRGKARIMGTHRIKSRRRERVMACTGLPSDCRKILTALWMQQSKMVKRYMRKA